MERNFYADLNGFCDRIREVVNIIGNANVAAKKIGVTSSSVARWIKGEADPSRTNLIKIAEAANVEVNWLATGQGPMCASGVNLVNERLAAYNFSEKNERMGAAVGQAFDVKGRPVDIDEFVFIPLYDVTVSAGHGTWTDDMPPKSTLAFRRDWLDMFITSDFSKLSVVVVKGDSMSGTLNDKDTILVDHSRTEASDGLYALQIGNETFVKRVQRLPHALRITSANPEYDPFEVPLQNGDSSDNSVTIIGKVVWLGRAI